MEVEKPNKTLATLKEIKTKKLSEPAKVSDSFQSLLRKSSYQYLIEPVSTWTKSELG